MNTRNTLLIGSLAVALAAVTTVYANAGRGPEPSEGALASQAKISLGEAAARAESHLGGRATRAELEQENGELAYEVEIRGKDNTSEVSVDAVTGRIMRVADDREDHAGPGEKQQEERDD